MTFSHFSSYLQQIEQTTKRLQMTELLSQLFKELAPEEIRPVSYLLQGKLVPKYEPLEFQLSIKMLIRVLARVSQSTEDEQQNDLFGTKEVDVSSKELMVTAKYKQLGDLGTVAEQLLENVPTSHNPHLSIQSVFTKLTAVAQDQGKGSQERKVLKTIELLSKVDPLSARYIVRIILGKLRLGFSDMTMIDALSWSLVCNKTLAKKIEEAYQKRADIGYIAEVVLTEGVQAIEKVEVAVGTPIIPALCQRLNTTEEIIAKMQQVYAEPKYDGTRVQIHFQRTETGSQGVVRTFTRNLEENSQMFPELEKLAHELTCDSCVLDAEAIGYDPATGQLLPFQETITRKRKHGIADAADALPLRFFIFDIMAKDGKSLLNEPLSNRKEILNQIFTNSDTFVHAPFVVTSDPQALHTYHEAQLAEGLEGLVMKKYDSVYQSGRKGYSWVKIKESEGSRGKLSDTLDCIVMGYSLATGVRTSFVIGSLLVGLLDKEGKIVTISKVGSGLAEELAKELVKRTDALKVKTKPVIYEVEKQLIPDVWLDPELVIEVAADEITKSPLHTAKVALRFPRILRIRDDKGWQEATTVSELSTITHLKEGNSHDE